MSFTLTPPLVGKNRTAFAVLQVDSEPVEPLVIQMEGWSALQLLLHWRQEIDALLKGVRNKCCIVSGLRVVRNLSIPSEWWLMHRKGDHARLRYQVLRTTSASEWQDPANWWKNIAAFRPSTISESPVSEWIVPVADLHHWCAQCDVLLDSIKALEED